MSLDQLDRDTWNAANEAAHDSWYDDLDWLHWMPIASREAIKTAIRYMSIDGGHHKQWVIDQMLRHLMGPNYTEFIKWWESDGEPYDPGIAP